MIVLKNILLKYHQIRIMGRGAPKFEGLFTGFSKRRNRKTV
jgi:hypothetical protein